VPNVRTCTVAFTDTDGIRHSVEVMASSLYEAAALGLAELRRCAFADASPGRVTRLAVTVKSPATTHELTVGKLEDWLAGGARSPNEAVLKDRLREVLRHG
jgi:hypothetical protein